MPPGGLDRFEVVLRRVRQAFCAQADTEGILAVAQLGGRVQLEAKWAHLLELQGQLSEATDDRNGIGQRLPNEVQT